MSDITASSSHVATRFSVRQVQTILSHLMDSFLSQVIDLCTLPCHDAVTIAI